VICVKTALDLDDEPPGTIWLSRFPWVLLGGSVFRVWVASVPS
jgi:hypothetical protein